MQHLGQQLDKACMTLRSKHCSGDACDSETNTLARALREDPENQTDLHLLLVILFFRIVVSRGKRTSATHHHRTTKWGVGGREHQSRLQFAGSPPACVAYPMILCKA